MLKHLSFTKMDIFKKSEKNFIKKYILKEKVFITKEMRFGKTISDKLERGEPIEWVAVLDTPEQELRADILWVPCLWYIDTCNEDFRYYIEYKTWKTKWTQGRVNKHDQLLMYAAMIHELHWIIPTCSLVWIETRNDDIYWIHMTGKVESFDRSFTLEGIETFKNKLPKIWKDMNNLLNG